MRIIVLLYPWLRPGLNPQFDNLISLGSTERRGVTLRGEHPLRRRAAVSVLPDRRGGKINRCLLSSAEICCFALSPTIPAVWMMNKLPLSVTVFVFVIVWVCSSVSPQGPHAMISNHVSVFKLWVFQPKQHRLSNRTHSAYWFIQILLKNNHAMFICHTFGSCALCKLQ